MNVLGKVCVGLLFKTFKGLTYLQKLVKVGVVQVGVAGKSIAKVLHGCLAVALQIGHDVWRVMLPQQIQYLRKAKSLH